MSVIICIYLLNVIKYAPHSVEFRNYFLLYHLYICVALKVLLSVLHLNFGCYFSTFHCKKLRTGELVPFHTHVPLTNTCFCLQVLADVRELVTFSHGNDGDGCGGARASVGDVTNRASGKHRCTYCSYATDNVTRLRSHTMIHTGERPHACPYCSYRSVWKHTLHRHIKFKHATQNNQ